MNRRRRGGPFERISTPLLVRIVAWGLRVLAWSWRIEIRGENPLVRGRTEPCLGAVWHRNILIGAGVFRDTGLHVPISLSRDGDRITGVIRHLGFGETPRGSSSRRRFSLLKTLIRLLESGAVIAMLTDGPRGPARVSKTGIVNLAHGVGVPVIPVALAARPCIRVSSWDRMILPLPFARVVVDFGEPLDPRACGEDFEEPARRTLDERLNAMTDALDTELGVPSGD